MVYLGSKKKRVPYFNSTKGVGWNHQGMALQICQKA